jgi:hemerythrin
MAYMEWQDSFSVNIKEIDDQHRVLIDKVNILHDAMLMNKGQEIQKETIYGMVDYATVHFDTEENYMQRFHFPDFSSHKAEHDRFTKKALELKERAESNGFILTIEILVFLKEWLQNHILGSDANYAEHFNKHGLY